MNYLPREKQVEAISALCEGVSIRATERLTGVNRGTIMALGFDVGLGCSRLHSALMCDLQVPRIELDEIWSYVGKKRKTIREGEDDTLIGDQYVFIALAGAAKAIISYYVGKRTLPNTLKFATDLRERVLGAPEISCDGFPCYPQAIEKAFKWEHKLGVVEKTVATMEADHDAARRYSPGSVIGVTKRVVFGDPRRISTSYVERQNLTMRMQQRRFTRLTNGFSKKMENHCAAVALYVSHYNFCRVHETLRVTPAMQLGVTDHIWTIGELVDAALDGDVMAPTPRKTVGGFRVIRGGKD
jgi:IS1 family transposase